MSSVCLCVWNRKKSTRYTLTFVNRLFFRQSHLCQPFWGAKPNNRFPLFAIYFIGNMIFQMPLFPFFVAFKFMLLFNPHEDKNVFCWNMLPEKFSFFMWCRKRQIIKIFLRVKLLSATCVYQLLYSPQFLLCPNILKHIFWVHIRNPVIVFTTISSQS